MKAILVKYRLEIIGILVGAVTGWGYWFFIGCSSGTCAITSKPLNSILYFAVLGGLISGMFKKENKKQKS